MIALQEESKALPLNIPGKYYVTENCNGCAYCALLGPDNFVYDRTTDTYFIGKQPVSPEEIEAVTEAVGDCPVDAIGVHESKNHRTSSPNRRIVVENTECFT